MLGNELLAMSPMKVTHEALQLQGDYVIDGDVTIGELLQVQDVRDAVTQRSAAVILQQALRVDQSLENVNLRFEQPLSANDTQLSFINALDMQELVQLNVEQVQVIEGVKFLPQSLTIRDGFGEVNILNGINVEQLPQLLLLKSSNQSIKFPMQLAGLEAPQLNANKLLLNGLELQEYMRHSGEQLSNNSLYVEYLQAEQLGVDQLHMHGSIFGHTLDELFQQGAQRPHSWQLPEHFNGTIHARNVWLKGHINNASVAQVEQQLQQLAGNIKYVGDFTFRHAVNISGLSFGDTLNGIAAPRLGNCWLENSEKPQQFTAPQALSAIASDKDVLLQGRLNNFTLEQLVKGSYRLNGTEHLQAVKFGKNQDLLRYVQAPLTNRKTLLSQSHCVATITERWPCEWTACARGYAVCARRRHAASAAQDQWSVIGVAAAVQCEQPEWLSAGRTDALPERWI